MTARRSLLLLAVVVPALLAGLWWQLDRGGREATLALPGPTPSGASLASGPVAGGPLALELARGDESTPTRAAPEAASAGTSEDPTQLHPSRVPRDARWLRGRVEFPPDVPPDEELWVIGEGARFFETEDSPRRHRVAVEPDGTFRVAFARRTQAKGRLTLEGRYLYLPEPAYPRLEDAAEEEVVLRPLVGACLEVTVLPPRAAAFERGVLEGVEVRTDEGPFQGESELVARRVDESVFQLGGLPPTRSWTIEATSPRFARARLADLGVEAGQVERVELALLRGATLSGTVLDASGAPCAGAEVAARPRTDTELPVPIDLEPGAKTSSDAQGRFVLVGVQPGPTRLRVRSPGHLQFELDLGDLPDGHERSGISVRLDRGRVIAGRVLWPDGQPAEGAELRLAQPRTFFGEVSMPQVVGELVTGPDGSFELGGLLEGACDLAVTAIHPDDRPDPASALSRLRARRAPRWTARLPEVQPGSRGLEVVLTRGGGLAGVAVDDRGRPVRSFSVSAMPRGDGILGASHLRPVRGRFQSAAGEFALEGLADGEWEVTVSATSHADSTARRIEIPGGGTERFVLARAASLEGTVRDPRGEPLASAQVRIDQSDGKGLELEAGAGGVFKAAELAPGRVTLRAQAEGHASSTPLELQLLAGQKREGLVLALRAGASIRGVIHPGQEVRAGRRVELSGPTHRATTSDSDASFAFEGLEPGEYQVALAAVSSGGEERQDWLLSLARRSQVDVTLAVGEEAQVVLGTPSPDEVRVRGRVLRKGEPVAGATVTVAERTQPGELSGGAKTDADGRYALTLERPGAWIFRVSRDTFGGAVSFEVDVPAGGASALDLVLPRARVLGRVTEPGGAPAAKVAVQLVRADDGGGGGVQSWLDRRRVTTDAGGAYAFDDVMPGEYKVVLGGPEGWTAFGRQRSASWARAEMPAKVEGEDDDARVDVELRPAGTVRGEVLGADGAPVAGAQVSVGPAGATFVVSEADGSFTYPGVAGHVEARARLDELESAPLQLDVPEGGEVFVRLVLEPR